MISRRKMLATLSSGVAMSVGMPLFAAEHDTCASKLVKSKSGVKLPIGINGGTILRYKLPLTKQIELAAKYDYDAVEIWTRDIDAHVSSGGKLSEIKAMLEDNRVSLPNVIGFAKCFVDDKKIRHEAMEGMKRDMEKTAALGGKNIAATMLGVDKFDTAKIVEYADRYREIIELGEGFGVSPLLELWGHRALSKVAYAAAIALAANHKSANLLLDFYHIYRGGNSFDTLDLLNLARMDVFHINDYPSVPLRESLTDADRVLPSDGVCDFKVLLPKMYAAGFRGVLSLEVFSNKAWANFSAEEMFKTGFEKTRATIAASLS